VTRWRRPGANEILLAYLLLAAIGLTAKQSEPVISEGAVLKDCAQWALASTSVLYLAWLWMTAPRGRSD
jgi:hypothetical protein